MLAPTQSQLVDANSSSISTIANVPPWILGQLTWRLIDDYDGTIITPESPDGIIEIDDGHDAYLRRYDRPFTAPASAGTYLAIWRHLFEEHAQTVIVSGSVDDIAFATVDDVAARLGRALLPTEALEAPWLLNMSCAVIADAAGYDDGWASRLNPVPQLLRMLSVILVCRALANPSEYTSTTEKIGAYNFQAARAMNFELSDAEVLMVRRAVHGRTTVSVDIESSFIRALDEYWLRKQAARFNDRTSTIA